ncbi:MAG: hypothetical protein R6U98_27830 [Pirellulaceae bacterium]
MVFYVGLESLEGQAELAIQALWRRGKPEENSNTRPVAVAPFSRDASIRYQIPTLFFPP